MSAVPFSELQDTGQVASDLDKTVAGFLPYVWDGIKWVSEALGFKARGGTIAGFRPRATVGHSGGLGQMKRSSFQR